MQAAALFRKEHSVAFKGRVLFLVLGDGHLRPQLEEQCCALGLEESVRFLGTRNDPEVFYPALDIVALTSLNEGTPLALIEAMANARPIVATAVGGVVDLLGSAAPDAGNAGVSGFAVRKHGILVPSQDAAAFARALAWLLGENELRWRMGQRGQDFVHRHYAKERLVNDIEDLYRDLLLPDRIAPVATKREPALTSHDKLPRRATKGKQPMRVFITGGAGFIGSHLADAYIVRGDEVCILDDLSTGSMANIQHLKNHPHFHYVIGNIHDRPLVAELLDGCDVAFHLAAAVGVKLIVKSPVRTLETNVHGTEVVLDLANKKGKKVLVASTSEVYGLSQQQPFREDGNLVLGATTKGRWSYACSKMLDEFLALAYWRERQLPTIIVRLFNTVGPRQTGHYGMVVPTFVQQALQGQPITVYGDGSQTRCFGYVGDVVESLVRLMDHADAVGEVFNIGSSEEVSIGELAEMVKVMTESSSEIVCVPYARAYGDGFEDMPRRVPDTSKLYNTIGFRPHVRLEEILRRVIAYSQKQNAAHLGGETCSTTEAVVSSYAKNGTTSS